MCNTRTPFSRATSLSLIVCLYLAYSKLRKLTATSNAQAVCKTRDCRWVSGASLLEVTCRQHSDGTGMCPTVSYFDARYTNAALPCISRLTFVTDDIAKMFNKHATYFAYNGLPWEATASWLTLLDSSRRADVNWHVTLVFTVSKTFTVKWLSEAQKPTPLPFWSRISWLVKILPPKGDKFLSRL